MPVHVQNQEFAAGATQKKVKNPMSAPCDGIIRTQVIPVTPLNSGALSRLTVSSRDPSGSSLRTLAHRLPSVQPDRSRIFALCCQWSVAQLGRGLVGSGDMDSKARADEAFEKV